jgi:PAT family beta-lactamase induction signal transducer AmpG
MGVPFSLVIWVTGTMFKDLGHSDAEITVATAAIGVAWSLKPLWAGFLDIVLSKRVFVLSMEFLLGALFVAMGFALQLPGYFGVIIAVMWLVAFASATQDICGDGIYIAHLDATAQAKFIGVQGMAWNLGRVVAVSLVVWLAGSLQRSLGMAPKVAWMYALSASGALMVLFGLYHSVALPRESSASFKGRSGADVLRDFFGSAANFCEKRSLWTMLAYVFFIRSSEGLLLLEAPLFMQGCLEDGGLQLSLTDKGTIDGTVSTLVGIAGGLSGGAVIARWGLRRTFFPLALCINVPHLCYVYLSQVVAPDNPLSFGEIALLVSIEKFWYSFGFIGNMLYMMQQIAPGRFRMTHYAIATAFMNLVLVPTQMVSGPLAHSLGFREYFLFVVLLSGPSLAAAWFAPFPQPVAVGAAAGASADGDAHVDDPARLTPDDRALQLASGRANAWAVGAVAAFLFIDVLVLGFLSTARSGGLLALLFAALAASTLLKIWLSLQGLGSARRALAAASPTARRGPYASNARGALVASVAMLLVTLGIGGYAAKEVVAVPWSCALSGEADRCLEAEPEPPRVCASPAPER